MKKNYLVVIIFLTVALATSLFLVLRTTVFVNRATSNPLSVVLENSYLFASPLQAKADKQEKIRLTIFILDGRGLGVPNQNINLDFSKKINLTAVQDITDNSGKAVFDFTSDTPGRFKISATTNKGKLPQEIKIVFY